MESPSFLASSWEAFCRLVTSISNHTCASLGLRQGGLHAWTWLLRGEDKPKILAERAGYSWPERGRGGGEMGDTLDTYPPLHTYVSNHQLVVTIPIKSSLDWSIIVNSDIMKQIGSLASRSSINDWLINPVQSGCCTSKQSWENIECISLFKIFI